MSQCQPQRETFSSFMSVEPMSGQRNRWGRFADVEGAMQDVAGPSSQSEPTDERLLRDYVASQDAGAFAAIMRRHGGMVSGVCRRVLGREQDVEDAFQATFLVLLRKAPSLSRPNLLGNWLYGVAYRISSKIRSANIRQRTREAPMVDLPAPDANDDASWRDLRPVFDDELRRLPQRYRRPIVLFYLEGKSAEEVATALGLPRGTVLSQLARAREQLRIRLSRRNLALSVGVFASLLERTASSDAAVPDRLLDLGMQTLPASGAGVSAQARLLAQQVLKEMLRRRLWTIGSPLFAALLAPCVGFLSYGAVRVRPVAVAPVAVVQAEARSNLDGLQGDWQVVVVEQGGLVLPKDQFPFTSLKIRDDTIVHEGGPHHLLKARFRLHPEQQPKAMDMESEGYHGDIYHAICALEGDTLKICRPDDATRPTEFASGPGSNVLLYTAKRIRHAGP
jgi:RNA polymerase sigma factor (sigma-70 family)